MALKQTNGFIKGLKENRFNSARGHASVDLGLSVRVSGLWITGLSVRRTGTLPHWPRDLGETIEFLHGSVSSLAKWEQ